MALVTFVDENRQWFKSRIGIEVQETSRDVSFCAHAILEEDLLVVEDARLDRRFADNPFVMAAPSIRFYAGAQLSVANGMPLGSLCVVDTEPRQLSAQQIEALKVLRSAVVTQLELRRAVRDLQDLERLVSICAWCRAVHNGDGRWLPLHDYVNEAVPVTHGICPSCADTARDSWTR